MTLEDAVRRNCYWFADVISQQQKETKRKKNPRKNGKLWAVNKENDNLKHDTRQIFSFCSNDVVK